MWFSSLRAPSYLNQKIVNIMVLFNFALFSIFFYTAFRPTWIECLMNLIYKMKV